MSSSSEFDSASAGGVGLGSAWMNSKRLWAIDHYEALCSHKIILSHLSSWCCQLLQSVEKEYKQNIDTCSFLCWTSCIKRKQYLVWCLMY